MPTLIFIISVTVITLALRIYWGRKHGR